MGIRARLMSGGRIVIPAAYRRALGLQAGDEVITHLDDGEVRVLALDEAIRRAQEVVSRYVPSGRSLADELIADRRAEAKRE